MSTIYLPFEEQNVISASYNYIQAAQVTSQETIWADAYASSSMSQVQAASAGTQEQLNSDLYASGTYALIQAAMVGTSEPTWNEYYASGSFELNGATIGVEQYILSSAIDQPAFVFGTSVTQYIVDDATFDDLSNTDPISDQNPSSLEGAHYIDWDAFSAPAEGTVPVTVSTASLRDATRYHKSYSFSRNRPARIRIFRPSG